MYTPRTLWALYIPASANIPSSYHFQLSCLVVKLVMMSCRLSSMAMQLSDVVLFLLLLLLVSLLHTEASVGIQHDPSSSTSQPSGLFQSPKVHVIITNGLDQNLTLHCKSRDDDLGFHYVSPASNWDFRFRTSFFDSTLFFCSFQWSNQFHYFDVYDHVRDGKRCKRECPWTVGPTGLCLYGTGKCYEWNKPST